MDRCGRGARWAAALAIVALAGCRSVPRVEADRAALAGVRTVALLRIREPLPAMDDVGGIGNLGMAGQWTQMDSNMDDGEAWARHLRDAGVRFAPAMARAVSEALAADGYQVVVPEGAPATCPIPICKPVDLAAIRTDADAILAVTFQRAGYASPPEFSDYIPQVMVTARLVDARSHAVLYEATLFGGYVPRAKGAVGVAADPRYRYRSPADVHARFAEAVQGVLETTAAVVARLGADLARR